MAATEQDQSKAKRRLGRSPAYPNFSVEKALQQTKALREREGDYAAPLASVFTAWGYSEKSSGGRQTLSTLKYFGLIDIAGEGDARKIKVSEIAKKILLDEREDQSDRRARIKEVALNPAIHKILVQEYPNGIASDATVRHFLIFEQGYNQEAANEVIAEFRETASYAGLYEPYQASEEIGNAVDKFAIGDYVNFEINDQIQWRFPWKIVEVKSHTDGLKYCRVQGTGEDTGQEGWIPMQQAVKADPPKGETGSISNAPFFQPPKVDAARQVIRQGMKEDKASLDEGEVVLLWPEKLSAESVLDFEYWVNGLIMRAKRRAGIADQKPNDPTSSS